MRKKAKGKKSSREHYHLGQEELGNFTKSADANAQGMTAKNFH